MNAFFNFLKTLFYLAFAAGIITLCCFVFAGCRSAKINSSRQKTELQTSAQVEVKKQESTVATMATTIQENSKKEGYNSWSISLSLDSDAAPFSFTLPDGSTIAGKGKNFSGTGKLTETRSTYTQQNSTEQRDAKSDITAKQDVQKSEEVQSKQVERKASTFWRPVAIGGLIAVLLLGAFLYFYFKPIKF